MTARRIAAALLSVALSAGVITAGAGSAEALKDTSWPIPATEGE